MSVPPHLEAVAVATRQPRQLTVCAVREVVQVVAGDEVLGEHVGTVLSRKGRESDQDCVAAATKKKAATKFVFKVLSTFLVTTGILWCWQCYYR